MNNAVSREGKLVYVSLQTDDLYRFIIVACALAVLVTGCDRPGSSPARNIEKSEANQREPEFLIAESFFSDPEMISVCNQISKMGGKPRLNKVLSQGKINQEGEKGVTLLHWAFFSGNPRAFFTLLQAGADPSKKTTVAITLPNGEKVLKGENIVQSLVRLKAWIFLRLALSNTVDKANLVQSGDSLLIMATEPLIVTSLDLETVQAMIDAKVPLDQADKFGATAAYRALIWYRSDITLRLLQAGASADIVTQDNDTIRKRFALLLRRQQSADDSLPDQSSLLAWLEAN